MTDATVEVRGFQLGVVDFITKPFSAPVLLNRIKTHLDMDEVVKERTQQIQRLKNAIVFSFADIVERRDNNTGGHIDRTTEYIKVLLEAMVKRGVHDDLLKNINHDSFISSARLHDVGKISIPDSILNKPDKLTDAEFAIMKTHAAIGEATIVQMASRASDDEFLQNAKLFAGYHHERWDGLGYPYGLKGSKIPIQGRVMAVVDVYDALMSDRPYKKAFSAEETEKIIKSGAGVQFDPYITDVFIEVADKFREINKRISDG